MAHSYFIFQDNNRLGPFDLVAVIKRIRNGSIQPDTLLIQDDATPVQAVRIPELTEFFNFTDHSTFSQHPVASSNYLRQLTFSKAVKTGWQFLLQNQIAAVITAALLLFILLTSIAVWELKYVGIFIGLVFSYFAFGIFQLTILRLVRGQALDLSFLSHRIIDSALPLFLASASIALLASVGIALLIVPGVFILSLFVFTPLLILDKQLNFKEAMSISARTVMGGGLSSFTLFFNVSVMNFIALACFILPLLITLPISIAAIADIYEETF